MAATLHAGIIPGAEAKKLYSYPTLPADSEKLLLGNGTWGSVYHHQQQVTDTIGGYYFQPTGVSKYEQNKSYQLSFGQSLGIKYKKLDSEGHMLNSTSSTGGTIQMPRHWAGISTTNEDTGETVTANTLGLITRSDYVKWDNARDSLVAALPKLNSLVSLFNGQWSTSIDASGCMVIKAANGLNVFKIDKAGEW